VYRTRILDAATRDLARLDKPIGRRIVERIRWLAENLDDVRPEALFSLTKVALQLGRLREQS
jgi:mRNA interferase RelE/StbE